VLLESLARNIYWNIYYGFEIRKPDHWHQLNSNELDTLVPNSNTSISIIPLFGFSEYPFSRQIIKYDPNIIGLSMKMFHIMKIKDDCELFTIINEEMESTGIKILSKSDCHKIDINGKQLVAQNKTLQYGNSYIGKQTHYIRGYRNGVFLTFELSFIDERSNIILEDIIHTLKFSL